MAEEVQIQDSPEGAQAKLRSPLGVAVLVLVTLGIYGFFWWYYINKEMVEYGRAKGTDELGDSPGKSVLALFPGGLLIIPSIMSTIGTSKRTQAAARLSGRPEGINGWIALLLLLFITPAFYAYLQSDLNKTWEQQSVGGGGALPSGETFVSTTTPLESETAGPTPGS